MLDLKRLKRYLSFPKKSNLNIAPSYEEKFGIKKNGSLHKPHNEKGRTIKQTKLGISRFTSTLFSGG